MERADRESGGEHRTIAIDLIGYGSAPNPDTGSRLALDDEAKRVETILHEIFGYTPMFHLVGHSYGGGVALRLARNLPHRVTSLALFEPTAFHVLPDGDIGRDEIEQVVAVMKWALEGGAPNAAVELFIDYWAGIGAYTAVCPHLRGLFAGKVETALKNFRALLDEPATLDDYAKLTMPACLIVGDSSPSSSRRVAKLLSRTFACCERHSVEGSHMAPITHPDFVNPIIERFITTVEACPAPKLRIQNSNRASCSAQAA